MTSSHKLKYLEQKLWQNSLEVVKQTDLYQSLTKRRIQTPNGFAAVEQTFRRAAAIVQRSHHSPALNYDLTLNDAVGLTILLDQQQAPVYWVHKALSEALLQTTVPAHVFGMHRAIPSCWLMLPKGLFTSPEGDPVECLGISHRLSTDAHLEIKIREDYSIQVPPSEDRVWWFTVLGQTSPILYSGMYNIAAGKTKLDEPIVDLSCAAPGDDPVVINAFTDRLGRFALQVLLVLQAKPELLEVGKPMGFGAAMIKSKPQRPATDLWSPTWIGRTYQPVVQAGPVKGTHARPRTHWRKGHFKRVRIGSKENSDYRTIWIEPTLVNADLA